MGPEQPRRDAARWNTVELQSRFAVNPEIGPRCGASPPDPSFVAANARILIANGMLRRWTGCDECSEVSLWYSTSGATGVKSVRRCCRRRTRLASMFCCRSSWKCWKIASAGAAVEYRRRCPSNGSGLQATPRLFPGHYAHIRQVPVLFSVVQAVADDEFIRNLESDIVALNGQLAPRGFVEQGGDLEGLWLVGQEEFSKESQRQPGIENVLDQDDIFAFHGLVHVLGDAYLTGGVPAVLQFVRGARAIAIAGDADKVERGIEVQVAGQVAEENGCPLQYAHEDDGLPGEIARDFGSQFFDALGNLIAGDEGLQFRHGTHM